jgi:hypothetical protein
MHISFPHAGGAPHAPLSRSDSTTVLICINGRKSTVRRSERLACDRDPCVATVKLTAVQTVHDSTLNTRLCWSDPPIRHVLKHVTCTLQYWHTHREFRSRTLAFVLGTHTGHRQPATRDEAASTAAGAGAGAGAAADGQLKLQTTLNDGPPPPDTNTNLGPMAAGQSWDQRRPHAPARHNPS